MMKKLGYIGVMIIQMSYLAQIYKVILTKQVVGLSPLFMFLVWLGLILLQFYSVYIKDWVYIISNFLGLANTSFLLVLIYIWG